MEAFLYRSIHLFLRGMGAIPRPLSILLSRVIGAIWYRMDRRHREITLENLTLAYGSEKSRRSIERLSRAVFFNLSRILFEVGWALPRSRERFNRHFKIIGLEHLERAHARGRGVLLLTGHLGNWELLTNIPGMTPFPYAAVYRTLDVKSLNRFFEDFRSRFGARLIRHRSGMRHVLKSLQRQECVALLLDQSTRRSNGVFVNFFGRPTCTNKGLALLALKTGAPVLPTFLYRRERGFTVEFGPELPLFRTGDKEKDIESNTAQYNQVIESYVRRFPEQWFWVHRRWKVQPDAPSRESDRAWEGG
jgi:Kdo2-lipid IVA lauroyltransferase/acyltransferase